MITIVDYGLGNIKAFANIYGRLNMNFYIAKNKEELSKASKIILPGVGSFDHAMQSLHASGMKDILDSLVLEKKIPVLGVCVGMQMLACSSDEGKLPGLGWIDGVVKKFDVSRLNQYEPLPHMGWNNVCQISRNQIFKDLESNSYFYFLHSYYFKCHQQQEAIATAHYGENFSCIVNKENIYGIQCHPEKSHQAGITFLKNFGNL